jgi:hypothetical protein
MPGAGVVHLIRTARRRLVPSTEQAPPKAVSPGTEVERVRFPPALLRSVLRERPVAQCQSQTNAMQQEALTVNGLGVPQCRFGGRKLIGLVPRRSRSTVDSRSCAGLVCHIMGPARRMRDPRSARPAREPQENPVIEVCYAGAAVTLSCGSQLPRDRVRSRPARAKKCAAALREAMAVTFRPG